MSFDPTNLIIGLTFHSLTVVLCVMHTDHILEDIKPNKWLYWVLMFLPIVNFITAMVLLETSLKVYRRNYKDEVMVSQDLRRSLGRIKDRYEETIKKFRKRIKIGDRFRVPNTDVWVDKFRGKECVIIEFNNDGFIANTKGDNKTRWSVKWDHVEHMVFLSDEPPKPFENIK